MATADHATGFEKSSEALWYKDAIIYQVHVRAFFDSDGDGVGDFAGLTQKLDYLQDLGVNAVWLLPFYPSPLKDDGYDISDYTDVNPMYGDLGDFKAFLREAHARGLKVITELVLNHTSDQHAWFRRARRAKPGSPWRDYYVWSETSDKYRDARIIFKDFETSNWTWDPAAKAYFWHRFYAHQPDLNFDHPHVRQQLFQVLDHWLKLGVDGLRLDAVPYLFEREGTNCENLPETHAFLKELRRHIDQRFENRMLLAEANQWPDDALAYFGQADECHTAFHFPLMPRMFMAIRMEDRFPIADILAQTPPIPDTCQWVLFLRNHDELTLEMVSDEERDYMYRVYAHDRRARINLGIRRRLAPLLGNNRRKLELMHCLLFSLPGTPVIYYGDELGMGDNIYLGDRDGVRTPMQWSADRNAGFSRANPQRLYLPPNIDPEYSYETVNVETQYNNPQSLLWWMKRVMALRQLHQAFSRGSLELLQPANPKVLAFVRAYHEEKILVVANLSRFSQYVELDLSADEGALPVELFGRTKFPVVRRAPYLLTLGPHGFFWFSLERPQVDATASAVIPSGKHWLNAVTGHEAEVFRGRTRSVLERILRQSMSTRRWFAGEANTVQAARIVHASPFGETSAGHEAYFVFLQVEYVEGEPETYLLLLSFAWGEEAQKWCETSPLAVVARLRSKPGNEEGVLFDATLDSGFQSFLLDTVLRRRRARALGGELVGFSTAALKRLNISPTGPLPAPVAHVEHTNSLITYGDQFILKLFHRIEPGANPDSEVSRFLTETAGFEHIPSVLGALEYRRDSEEPYTLGILQQFVPNQGTAWHYSLDTLGRYFEDLLAEPLAERFAEETPQNKSLLTLIDEEVPPRIAGLARDFLPRAELLGQRTAEMHVALATAEPDNPDFAPEPFTTFYQRSLFQSMRRLAGPTFQLLRAKVGELPAAIQPDAQAVLDHEKAVVACLRSVVDHKITAQRIRCHGDYHLGQVLYTGRDFVIFDFEGETQRSISERRLKRSPLGDVVGMLRSFHRAAASAFFRHIETVVISPDDVTSLRHGAHAWQLWSGVRFLKSYLAVASQHAFLPPARHELELLLHALLMEKAIYELSSDLANQPKWVDVPLRAMLDLLAATHSAGLPATHPAAP